MRVQFQYIIWLIFQFGFELLWLLSGIEIGTGEVVRERMGGRGVTETKCKCYASIKMEREKEREGEEENEWEQIDSS